MLDTDDGARHDATTFSAVATITLSPRTRYHGRYQRRRAGRTFSLVAGLESVCPRDNDAAVPIRRAGIARLVRPCDSHVLASPPSTFSPRRSPSVRSAVVRPRQRHTHTHTSNPLVSSRSPSTRCVWAPSFRISRPSPPKDRSTSTSGPATRESDRNNDAP